MAIVTTYDDGNRLEDVLGMVIMLSPTDTPFISGIGKTRAKNTIHQWPENSLETRNDATVATNDTVIEGASQSFVAPTPPSRVVNLTQILSRQFAVSSTEQWVQGAGVDNSYTFAQQKALMELGNVMEHVYLRSSLASGNVTVKRRMAGAMNFVTTNATAVASGTKLTESFFNGLGELCYTQGGRPNEVYVGARLKRQISSFTAGSTKNIASEDKRLVLSTDIYESDFGVMKVMLCRDMPVSLTAVGNGLLMIDSTKFKMAVGEPARILSESEVAQSVHGKQGIVRSEGTLEVLGQRFNAKATNLSNKLV